MMNALIYYFFQLLRKLHPISRRVDRRTRRNHRVINGPGAEIGKTLATSPRIAKVAFTGETTTGRLIMQYASQNVIPVTLELGGKSPNIFFEDICAQDDEFLDKAVEGLVMFAFNQGEVCTCPSRALIQESIYDRFMEKAIDRIRQIKQDNPLDPTTALARKSPSTRWKKSPNTSKSVTPKAQNV